MWMKRIRTFGVRYSVPTRGHQSDWEMWGLWGRNLLAAHTYVLVVLAIVSSPVQRRALRYVGEGPRTAQVVEPNRTRAFPEVCAEVPAQVLLEASDRPAYDVRIATIERVVADRTPDAVVAHFHASAVGARSVH